MAAVQVAARCSNGALAPAQQQGQQGAQVDRECPLVLRPAGLAIMGHLGLTRRSDCVTGLPLAAHQKSSAHRNQPHNRPFESWRSSASSLAVPSAKTQTGGNSSRAKSTITRNGSRLHRKTLLAADDGIVQTTHSQSQIESQNKVLPAVSNQRVTLAPAVAAIQANASHLISSTNQLSHIVKQTSSSLAGARRHLALSASSRSTPSAATTNSRVRQGALYARRQYNITQPFSRSAASHAVQSATTSLPANITSFAGSSRQQCSTKLSNQRQQFNDSDAILNNGCCRKSSTLTKTPSKFSLTSSTSSLSLAVVKRAKASPQVTREGKSDSNSRSTVATSISFRTKNSTSNRASVGSFKSGLNSSIGSSKKLAGLVRPQDSYLLTCKTNGYTNATTSSGARERASPQVDRKPAAPIAGARLVEKDNTASNSYKSNLADNSLSHSIDLIAINERDNLAFNINKSQAYEPSFDGKSNRQTKLPYAVNAFSRNNQACQVAVAYREISTHDQGSGANRSLDSDDASRFAFTLNQTLDSTMISDISNNRLVNDQNPLSKKHPLTQQTKFPANDPKMPIKLSPFKEPLGLHHSCNINKDEVLSDRRGTGSCPIRIPSKPAELEQAENLHPQHEAFINQESSDCCDANQGTVKPKEDDRRAIVEIVALVVDEQSKCRDSESGGCSTYDRKAMDFQFEGEELELKDVKVAPASTFAKEADSCDLEQADERMLESPLACETSLRESSICNLKIKDRTQSGDIDIAIKKEPISDDYDLEARPFARGKFAQVKRCISKVSRQCFAAKCIKKRRRLVDIRHEILLEIEALKLSFYTDRIVKLYEVYETPNEMILVLEMANGGELQRVLDDEESIDERIVRRMVRQILEGLVQLHDNEIAHLDIKPQNLLLTEPYPNGDIKLCDFGISRRITKECEIREICGTPDYVAPEILRYDPISLTTDMWSLGILTYVLLSGYSPFGSDNKQQTFCNITQAKLDFPNELFSKISREAIDFIQKLVLREPSERLTSRQARNHSWLLTHE